MRISVIVPNLNDEKYLPLFLKSFDHQTHHDKELIIIDGGSQDDSVHVIESFGKVILVVDRKKNFGYIRNVGARFASGDILFHSSSDTYMEPHLLEKIHNYYVKHPECVALAGRTYPMGTSIFAHVGYQIFDFLRFIFTVSPMPLKKFRPSGNFTTVRRQAFNDVGGFPEVPINEDGLFGAKFDKYLPQHHKKVMFHLGLWVGHSTRRFEAQGGLRTILFYFYALGNLFPLLNPLLKHIEVRSSKVWTG